MINWTLILFNACLIVNWTQIRVPTRKKDYMHMYNLVLRLIVSLMNHGFYTSAVTPFRWAFTGLETIANLGNKISHGYYLKSFLSFWPPQSLQLSLISIQFFIYIINITVGITIHRGSLTHLFSGINNSFISTKRKAFIAISYVALEFCMMLILSLLAASQLHNYLSLWQEVIFSSCPMYQYY